jgi:thymidine kinase
MSLELILGPMFAGKSSAILGVLRRNEIISRRTLCITSALDTRYSDTAAIVSHNKESYPAIAAKLLVPIMETDNFKGAKCIVIEESQFFPDLKEFVLAAVDDHKKEVICVGLDGDSERRPFGQITELIPYADSFKKLTALCQRCGDGTEAIFTFRKPGAAAAGQIAVGGADKYEPVCRRHYHEERRQVEIEQFMLGQLSAAPQPSSIELLETCVGRFGAKEGAIVYENMMVVLTRSRTD